MKIIDLNTWSRAEHYLFFKRMDYPHYHIGANLDITDYLSNVKRRGLAFSYALTYAVSMVMNEIEAFRYRIHGEQVVLHERIHPAFSYLAPNDENFKMVMTPLEGSVDEFVRQARDKALGQKKSFAYEDIEGRDDLIFISSIPWVSFTHLSHTISFNKSDAVPRLSWGKYFEAQDRVLIPFNIQAHHSFVDGTHMGAFFNKLQAYFDMFQ